MNTPIITVSLKKNSASPHHTEIVESEALAKKIRKAELKGDWNKVNLLLRHMNMILHCESKGEEEKIVW